MRTHILLSLAVVAAAALAGCTGRFDVDQTEPFRIAIEGLAVDGDSRTATVSAGTSGGTVTGGAQAKKEFRIENTNTQVQQVTVVVQVTPAASSPPPPPPPSNNTTEPNATPPTNTTVVTKILIVVEDRDTGEKLAERIIEGAEAQTADIDVNIQGHHNVVVITQALEGNATVNVSAKGKATTAPPDEGNVTAPPGP